MQGAAEPALRRPHRAAIRPQSAGCPGEQPVRPRPLSALPRPRHHLGQLARVASDGLPTDIDVVADGHSAEVNLLVGRWAQSVSAAEQSLQRLRGDAVRAEACSSHTDSDAWLVSAADCARPLHRPSGAGHHRVAVVGREALTELDVAMLNLRREQQGCLARSRLEVAAAVARQRDAEITAAAACKAHDQRAAAASNCLEQRHRTRHRTARFSVWQSWAVSTARLRRRRAWQQRAADGLFRTCVQRQRRRGWDCLTTRRRRRLGARRAATALLRMYEHGLRVYGVRALAAHVRRHQQTRSHALRAWALEQVNVSRWLAACMHHWQTTVRRRRNEYQLRRAKERTASAMSNARKRDLRMRAVVVLRRHAAHRRRCRQRARQAVDASTRMRTQLCSRYFLRLLRFVELRRGLKRLRRKADWMCGLTLRGLQRQALQRLRSFLKDRRRHRHRARVCETLLVTTAAGARRVCVGRLAKFAQLRRRQRQRDRRAELLLQSTERYARKMRWQLLLAHRTRRRVRRQRTFLSSGLGTGNSNRHRHRAFERLRSHARAAKEQRKRRAAVDRIAFHAQQETARWALRRLHERLLCARVARRNADCAQALLANVDRDVRLRRAAVWTRFAAACRARKARRRAAEAVLMQVNRTHAANRWCLWRLEAQQQSQRRLFDTAVAKVSLNLSAHHDKATMHRYLLKLRRWAKDRVLTRRQTSMCLQRRLANERALQRRYWSHLLHVCVARRRRSHANAMTGALLRRLHDRLLAAAWCRWQQLLVRRAQVQKTALRRRAASAESKEAAMRGELLRHQREYTAARERASVQHSVSEREQGGRLVAEHSEAAARDLLWQEVVRIAGCSDQGSVPLAQLEASELLCRRNLALRLATLLAHALEAADEMPAADAGGEPAAAAPMPPPAVHGWKLSPRTAACLTALPPSAGEGASLWGVLLGIFDWLRPRRRALDAAKRRSLCRSEETRQRCSISDDEELTRTALQWRAAEEGRLRKQLALRGRQLQILQDHIVAEAPPELLKDISDLVAEEARGRVAVATEQLRRLRYMRRLLLRLEKPFGAAGSVGFSCSGESDDAVISEVLVGGPAARSGIVVGDVVVGVRNPKGYSAIRHRADLLRAVGPEGHVFEGVTIGVVLKGRGFGGGTHEVRLAVGRISDGAKASRLRALAASKRRVFGSAFNTAACYDLCNDPEQCRALLKCAFAVADAADCGRLAPEQFRVCIGIVSQEIGCPPPLDCRVQEAFAEADTDEIGSLDFDSLFLYMRELFLEVIFGDGVMTDDPPPERRRSVRPASASALTRTLSVMGGRRPPTAPPRRSTASVGWRGGDGGRQEAAARPDGGLGIAEALSADRRTSRRLGSSQFWSRLVATDATLQSPRSPRRASKRMSTSQFSTGSRRSLWM